MNNSWLLILYIRQLLFITTGLFTSTVTYKHNKYIQAGKETDNANYTLWTDIH
jgi:hypothetical protein